MARFTTLVNLFGSGVSSTTPGSSSVLGSNNVIFDVSARRLMSVQLTAGSQNSVFDLQISNDGTNFVRYDRLTTNVANTNAQTDIGTTIVAVSANTSVIYFIRAGDTFRYVRGSVTLVGTDSNYNAVLHGID